MCAASGRGTPATHQAQAQEPAAQQQQQQQRRRSRRVVAWAGGAGVQLS
jgi:hypothetical protein